MSNKYIGVQLPLTNSDYGYFNPSTLTVDQLATNIKCILLTNKNERIFRPEFGCSLMEEIFNITDDDSYTNIENTIKTNIEKYIPDVKVKEVEILTSDDSIMINLNVEYYDEDEAITITYDVKQ